MKKNQSFFQQHFDTSVHESVYFQLKENESIMEETYGLYHDLDLFFFVIKELLKERNYLIIKRLCNWLAYFNAKIFHSTMIYNGMVTAVLKAALKNELIREQTQFEFETSLSFYDVLYSLQKNITINEEEAASILLNYSLIYGCYPGMQTGSLRKGLNELNEEVNRRQLENCFELLFVKYELPTIFVNEIDKIGDRKTINAFIHLLKGESFRKLNPTEIKLSKREVFLFMNFKGQSLKFENDILKRYLVYFKLLSVYEEQQKGIILFLNCSKLFELKLNKFIDNIAFWQQAVRLYYSFTEIQRNALSIREYVDFIEYKKFDENISYSLKGRTYESIRNAMNEFHTFGSYQQQVEMQNYQWNSLGLAEIEYHFKNETYLFEELNTGKKLFDESKKMNHCVFSYTLLCLNGHAHIYSIKKKQNNKFVHWLTIQVAKNEITQYSGPNNRNLTNDEMQLVEFWATNNNLVVSS